MGEEHHRRGNPHPPMSMQSAAITLWNWMTEHGRAPNANECRTANGLHWFQTYYKVFGMSNFSAEIIPLVSSLMSSMKTRRCRGYAKDGRDCEEVFLDQGAHVRLCDGCRRKQAQDGGEYHIALYTRSMTLEELGGGGGGWSVYENWVQDVNWSGP